jgi:excisionase family DNA binding protein
MTPLMQVRQAARALGVHENTVRRWEERGLLRAVRLPSGVRRFRTEDVEAMRAQMFSGLAPLREDDDGSPVSRAHPIVPKADETELTRFLGPVEDRDVEVIERWREASAEAHAQAMIELSRYAERTAAQTGLGKDPAERFPGIPGALSPGRKAA